MRRVVDLASVAVALEAPPGRWADAVTGLLRGLPAVDGPAVAAVRVIGSAAPAPDREPDERHQDLLPVAVGSFPLATNPPALRRYFRHAGAIARLPAWELLHPPDPQDRLEVAAGLLSRAAAAAQAP